MSHRSLSDTHRTDRPTPPSAHPLPLDATIASTTATIASTTATLTTRIPSTHIPHTTSHRKATPQSLSNPASNSIKPPVRSVSPSAAKPTNPRPTKQRALKTTPSGVSSTKKPSVTDKTPFEGLLTAKNAHFPIPNASYPSSSSTFSSEAKISAAKTPMKTFVGIEEATKPSPSSRSPSGLTSPQETPPKPLPPSNAPPSNSASTTAATDALAFQSHSALPLHPESIPSYATEERHAPRRDEAFTSPKFRSRGSTVDPYMTDAIKPMRLIPPRSSYMQPSGENPIKTPKSPHFGVNALSQFTDTRISTITQTKTSQPAVEATPSVTYTSPSPKRASLTIDPTHPSVAASKNESAELPPLGNGHQASLYPSRETAHQRGTCGTSPSLYIRSDCLQHATLQGLSVRWTLTLVKRYIEKLESFLASPQDTPHSPVLPAKASIATDLSLSQWLHFNQKALQSACTFFLTSIDIQVYWSVLRGFALVADARPSAVTLDPTLPSVMGPSYASETVNIRTLGIFLLLQLVYKGQRKSRDVLTDDHFPGVESSFLSSPKSSRDSPRMLRSDILSTEGPLVEEFLQKHLPYFLQMAAGGYKKSDLPPSTLRPDELELLSLLLESEDGRSLSEAFRLYSHSPPSVCCFNGRDVLAWLYLEIGWRSKRYRERRPSMGVGVDLERVMGSHTYTLQGYEKMAIVLQQEDLLQHTDLVISNCHECEIYALAGLRFAKIAACTSSHVIICAVSQITTVFNCSKLRLHVATHVLKVENTVDTAFYAYCSTPPLLLGDTRAIEMGPYNILCPLQRASLLHVNMSMLETCALNFASPICRSSVVGFHREKADLAAGAVSLPDDSPFSLNNRLSNAAHANPKESKIASNASNMSLHNKEEDGYMYQCIKPENFKIKEISGEMLLLNPSMRLNSAKEEDEALLLLPAEFEEVLTKQDKEIADLQKELLGLHLSEEQKRKFYTILALKLSEFVKRDNRQFMFVETLHMDEVNYFNKLRGA